MEIGVVFPQIEIGKNPDLIRKFTEKVEDLGYGHILIYDHVLGVDPNRSDWEGIFDYTDQFHEPLNLLSYLAAVTQKVDLITGILILPQRQTVLVAKQAAELDLLSKGRLKLGVGVGWNKYEFTALNKDFKNRGERIEEQIELMRKLWTNNLVKFEGKFHSVPKLGMNPLPVQQPIPIWIGGMADKVIKRIVKIGDGWIPQFTPGSEAIEYLNKLEKYGKEVGQDPDEIGIHGRMRVHANKEDQWIEYVEGWKDLEADFLSAYTMHQGLDPMEQLELLDDFISVLKNVGLVKK